MLGAEGVIGRKLYRFKKVLETGKNVIVYALFNPETRTRGAYGFDRRIFVGTFAGRGPMAATCAEGRRLSKQLSDRKVFLDMFDTPHAIREGQRTPEQGSFFARPRKSRRYCLRKVSPNLRLTKRLATSAGIRAAANGSSRRTCGVRL